MAYLKTFWQNGITPVNAGNMNKIEEALDLQDSEIAALNMLLGVFQDTLDTKLPIQNPIFTGTMKGPKLEGTTDLELASKNGAALVKVKEDGTVEITAGTSLNMLTKPIKNLAPPVDPADAVTLDFLTDSMENVASKIPIQEQEPVGAENGSQWIDTSEGD